jgi:hypothetical protein
MVQTGAGIVLHGDQDAVRRSGRRCGLYMASVDHAFTMVIVWDGVAKCQLTSRSSSHLSPDSWSLSTGVSCGGISYLIAPTRLDLHRRDFDLSHL